MTLPVAAPRRWRGRFVLTSLVAAEAVSNIGSRMSFFAIPWLVLVTTGNPVKVGFVAGAESLAYVVSGVLAAPLQDRLGARRMTIVSDVVSVGIMAAIAVFGRLDFFALVALVTLMGAVRSQGDRGKVTLLVPLMGRAGDYARVASIREGALRSSGLIGSSVAGVAIAFLGAIGAVWLDAASFGIAALLCAVAIPPADDPIAPADDPARAADAGSPTGQTAGAGSPTGQTAEGKPTGETYLDSLRTGFTWFRSNRLLRAITGMLFFTSVFNQASAVVFIPLWVLTNMDDPKALGAISTAYAIGLITGSAVFAWLSPVLPRYPMLVAGYIVGCAPRFLILALSDSLPIILVITLICGISMCTSGPTVTAAIYQRTPKDMLARAGGIITAVAFGGLPIGGVIGGILVQTLGLNNAILAISGLFFLVTLTPVVNYGLWRELNDTASTSPARQSSTRLHRFYAAGAIMTGLRLHLRYADAHWSVRVKRGLRTVVHRQPVEPKVAVAALTGLDFEPVDVALHEVLHHDRFVVSRQVGRMRGRVEPAEARVAALSMILNADR